MSDYADSYSCFNCSCLNWSDGCTVECDCYKQSLKIKYYD